MGRQDCDAGSISLACSSCWWFPLWLWLGRGQLEAVLVFLPALYAHTAYAAVSHFLPRYALPQVPLRVVATMVLLFLVWSYLRRSEP